MRSERMHLPGRKVDAIGERSVFPGVRIVCRTAGSSDDDRVSPVSGDALVSDPGLEAVAPRREGGKRVPGPVRGLGRGKQMVSVLVSAAGEDDVAARGRPPTSVAGCSNGSGR